MHTTQFAVWMIDWRLWTGIFPPPVAGQTCRPCLTMFGMQRTILGEGTNDPPGIKVMYRQVSINEDKVLKPVSQP